MMANPAQEHQYRFRPDHRIDGRYKVIEPLGFGGFAEVYKCREELLDQTYAVKVINLLTAREDVLREARIAARFRHPHILRVVHIGELEDAGNWYFVMDYREGSRSLEVVLDAAQENLRRLPLDENTLRIISEVADALHYAHQMNIVHQDIKPSNIIIDQDGHAYLTDFGLALTKRPPGTSMKTLDAVSGMSGTIPYMSPEQFDDIEGKQLGPSTDIYSLGVVAYEMLVGQWPYTSKAPGPIMQQIVSGLRTPPRQLNAELPERVQDVLLKVLSKEPSERYNTAVEFATALQEAAEAYITAEELYKEARTLVDKRQWREALSSLEQLDDHAPAYKETRLFLERTRKQVQLLDLYDQAQELLKRQEYEACLEKLDVLTQIEPNYVVKGVRERALTALVEQFYDQAVAQYQAGEYQECLDTFEKIHQCDPHFSDNEGIAGQARRALEHKQYLQALYSTSIGQIQQEDWAGAQETLERLHQEASDYSDVEARLTMVRHMARLSGMYQAAQAAYDTGIYAECIDHLAELFKIDDQYKPTQVNNLKNQAIGTLYKDAERLLHERKYEASIQALDELEKRTSHPDPQHVRDRAKQGISDRKLHQKLDGLYEQAVIYLNARQYNESLNLMEQIHRADPNYTDPRDVEQRARESWCSSLYTQALVALGQEQYQEALDRLARIHDIDSQYQDTQKVREQAVQGLRKPKRFAFLAGLRPKPGTPKPKPETQKVKTEPESAQAEPKPQRPKKPQRPSRRVIYGIAAVTAILLVVIGAWGTAKAIANRNATATAVAQATQVAVTKNAQSRGTLVAAQTLTAQTATSQAAKEQTATVQAAAIQTTSAHQTATAQFVAAQTIKSQTATAQAGTAQAETATAVHQAAADAVATATRAAIQTATAQPTPTPTSTPVPQGTAKQPSTIFEGPDDRTKQLGILTVGDTVPILGRSDERQYGRWLYVRMDEDFEGFVYEPRVEYTIDWASLPVIEVDITTPLPVPTPTPVGGSLIVSPGTLTIVHIWPASVCSEGGWTAYFEVKIKGGDGRNYKLYWDEVLVPYIVKESERDVAVVQQKGIRGMVIGTIAVESGGERVQREVSAKAPDGC